MSQLSLLAEACITLQKLAKACKSLQKLAKQFLIDTLFSCGESDRIFLGVNRVLLYCRRINL